MMRFAIFAMIFVSSAVLTSAFRAARPSIMRTPRLSMAVVTDATTTEEKFKVEALGKFLKASDGAQFKSTSGGVNNICDYTTMPNGEKYVLRIYNNGFDSERVKYEHAILNKLEASNQDLSFELPTPMPAIGDGKTHALISTGAEACLFKWIPGELPKNTRMRACGYACGELVTALSKISIDMPSPNTRYNEFFAAHHATTKENFYEYVATDPAFNVDETTRKYTDLLVEEIRYIEKCLERFDTMNLPDQLIHADLHSDNILVEGDKVSGLLDFEFASFDWRAAELAVGLSKYASFTDEAMDFFAEFMEGFPVHGRLKQREIDIMPELINMRILNNVVYFVGRAIAKEDTIDALTSRVETYYTRVKWITENRQKIVDLITEKMKAANAIEPEDTPPYVM